ncbi:hypothetical protein [Oleiharenicola lentus]|uniref:hypothetical protein n=1 Tax=Oleiharenicola lentus TaxID=2508720 RepID=UPI003F666D58
MKCARPKLPPHGYEGLPSGLARVRLTRPHVVLPKQVSAPASDGFSVTPLSNDSAGPVRMFRDGQPLGIFATPAIAAGTRRILTQ